jgi:hypothetical protein
MSLVPKALMCLIVASVAAGTCACVARPPATPTATVGHPVSQDATAALVGVWESRTETLGAPVRLEMLADGHFRLHRAKRSVPDSYQTWRLTGPSTLDFHQDTTRPGAFASRWSYRVTARRLQLHLLRDESMVMGHKATEESAALWLFGMRDLVLDRVR